MLKTITAAAAALAMAQGAAADAVADSDWLVERHGGDWQLVAKGPAGKVQKQFRHQEVLRLGQGGWVIVVSMPPIAGDDEVRCSQRARNDAAHLCSSNFLSCRPDPGGPLMVAVGLATGGADGARDQRNRLLCRIDEKAALEAAKSAGMIARIDKPAR